MAGRPPGWIVLGITAALEDQGEMTGAALHRALNANQREISSVISRMTRTLATRPKRLYVARWVFDEEGSDIAQPRAVYALGDLPCARKPKSNRAAVTRRARLKASTRVASVWDFALSRRARQAQRKQLAQEPNADHYSGL